MYTIKKKNKLLIVINETKHDNPPFILLKTYLKHYKYHFTLSRCTEISCMIIHFIDTC